MWQIWNIPHAMTSAWGEKKEKKKKAYYSYSYLKLTKYISITVSQVDKVYVNLIHFCITLNISRSDCYTLIFSLWMFLQVLVWFSYSVDTCSFFFGFRCLQQLYINIFFCLDFLFSCGRAAYHPRICILSRKPTSLFHVPQKINSEGEHELTACQHNQNCQMPSFTDSRA